MNLALVYLWKEWRAQRGILIAYTLLILASLCIGLSIAPTHYWLEEDYGVHA
jgi:NADH:ubiquinone oxidoreductase subunit 2 (subunit N)